MDKNEIAISNDIEKFKNIVAEREALPMKKRNKIVF